MNEVEALREEFKHLRHYASMERIENKLLVGKNYETEIHKKDKPLRCKIGWHKMDNPRYSKQTCLLCGTVNTDDSVFAFPPGGIL